VLNYSSASEEVLASASAETSRIFAQSGIDFAWTYCPLRPSPGSSLACDSESTPGEIRVRVLERHLNGAFQESIFGFANAPTLVTVYFDSAQRLVKTATGSDSYLPVVLGCLIAHEIGHLLLGNDQHTVSGIMRAGWDIQQIQQLMKGALRFTPQQAMRMRRNTEVRTRPLPVTQAQVY
jgi:hypothetical protein